MEVSEMIAAITDFFTYIFNSLIGQFGVSFITIALLCIVLNLFAVERGFIKRLVGNSILGMLALYGLKALGVITTISILDVILVSLFGIVGVVLVVAFAVFNINPSQIIG